MYSVVLQAFCALKWFHDLLPLESNPANSPLVRNIVDASKRSHHVAPTKKEPISIVKMVEKHANSDSDLKGIRTALLPSLGFFGLFRANELINIKAKDIGINDDHLVITVPKSKTDQYRNGSKVYIARTNGPVCPHALLLRYFDLARIRPYADEHIFRDIKTTGRKNRKITLGSRSMSYTRLRELVKEAIAGIGVDPKPYSTHSLRSGGATFMASSQADNLNRLLKLQGRWKSDSCKDIYIKDTLENRLTLTKKQV
jgi:integrase